MAISTLKMTRHFKNTRSSLREKYLFGQYYNDGSLVKVQFLRKNKPTYINMFIFSISGHSI